MDEKKIQEIDLTNLKNEVYGHINDVLQTVNQLQIAVEAQKNQLKEKEGTPEQISELLPAQIKSLNITEMTEAKNAVEQEKVKTFSVKGQKRNETDAQAITRELSNYKEQKEKKDKEQNVSYDYIQNVVKGLQQQIQASRKEPYNFYETEYTTGSPDDLFDEVNSLTKNPPSWIK